MRSSLLAVALLAVALAGTQARQAPQFSARTNLVVVPVVAVDNKGKTVPDLDVADFALTEDGKPMAITTFVPADDPVAQGREDGRFVVLVLDNLRTPLAYGWRVRDIASRFAKRMGPHDVVSVALVNGGRVTTSGRRDLVQSAIKRFAPFEAPFQSDERDAEHALLTISDLTRQMADVPHRRKILVWIGLPGMFGAFQFDDGAALGVAPPAQYSSRWLDAVRDSGRNNVSVYVINPLIGASGGDPTDGASGFAAGTGGEAFVHSVNVDRAVNRIWQDAGSYYLLGYAPPIDDHRIHRIDVSVKRPGVQVRARRLRG